MPIFLKKPKWFNLGCGCFELYFKIWIAILSLLSGFINVNSIHLFSVPISHHTGNMSWLAISIADLNFTTAFNTALIILAFFIGAFVSGLLFHYREFELKKRYGILLMGAALIFLSLHFVQTPQILKMITMSFIAGLQNAMFIYHKNILVRTTHITGYLTDAAFALAMTVRGKKNKISIFSFYIANIFFFLAGGIIASLIKPDSFFILSAGMYFTAGLYYFILRKGQK